MAAFQDLNVGGAQSTCESDKGSNCPSANDDDDSSDGPLVIDESALYVNDESRNRGYHSENEAISARPISSIPDDTAHSTILRSTNSSPLLPETTPSISLSKQRHHCRKQLPIKPIPIKPIITITEPMTMHSANSVPIHKTLRMHRRSKLTNTIQSIGRLSSSTTALTDPTITTDHTLSTSSNDLLPRRRSNDDRLNDGRRPSLSPTLLHKVLLKNAPNKMPLKKRPHTASPQRVEEYTQVRGTKASRVNEPEARQVVVRMSDNDDPTILSVINTNVKESSGKIDLCTQSMSPKSPVNETVSTEQLFDLLMATNPSQDGHGKDGSKSVAGESTQTETTINDKQSQTTISLCLPIRRFAVDASVQTDPMPRSADQVARRRRRRDRITTLQFELIRLQQAVEYLTAQKAPQTSLH